MWSVRTNVALMACLLSLGFTKAISATEKENTTRVSDHVFCQKYLSTEGKPLSTAKPYTEKVPLFLSRIKTLLPPNILPFEFKSFSARGRVDLHRLQQLAAMIFDTNPQSASKLEMDEYVKTLGGRNDPRFWAAYLRSYGRIVTYSSAYLEEMTAIDEILPTKGRILDIGGGPATMASFMALNRPERKMVFTDFEPEAIENAKLRLPLFTDQDKSRFETHVQDITTDHLPKNSVDGAYVHNVSYLFGEKQQQAINNMAFPLVEGAPFIYINVGDKPKEVRQQAMMGLAVSAVQNGSPADEFDYMFVGYANAYILLEDEGNRPTLLTDAQERAMLQEAGLIIHGVFESYGGVSRMYYTTKGPSPKEGSPSSKSGPQ